MGNLNRQLVRLAKSEIIDLICSGARRAVRNYEAVSGADDRMAECLIVAAIMDEVRETKSGMYALAEVNTANWKEKCGYTLTSISRKGRIDCVLYDPASDSSKARPRAVIEVKGPGTRWDSFLPDLDRLKEIVEGSSKIEFGVFLYVTAPLSENGIKRERGRFIRELNLTPEAVRQIGPLAYGNKDDGLRWQGFCVEYANEKWASRSELQDQKVRR